MKRYIGKEITGEKFNELFKNITFLQIYKQR